MVVVSALGWWLLESSVSRCAAFEEMLAALRRSKALYLCRQRGARRARWLRARAFGAPRLRASVSPALPLSCTIAPTWATLPYRSRCCLLKTPIAGIFASGIDAIKSLSTSSDHVLCTLMLQPRRLVQGANRPAQVLVRTISAAARSACANLPQTA